MRTSRESKPLKFKIVYDGFELDATRLSATNRMRKGVRGLW
jgi:hypothetical protein